MECEARNPCEMMFVINQSAVGATEKNKDSVVPTAFYCLWVIVLQAFRTACSIPVYNLLSLRDFFYEMPQGDVSTGDCCKKKRLFFLHVALGIEAASFAERSGAKIERKARRR